LPACLVKHALGIRICVAQLSHGNILSHYPVQHFPHAPIQHRQHIVNLLSG
jgi:hypothetical protein